MDNHENSFNKINHDIRLLKSRIGYLEHQLIEIKQQLALEHSNNKANQKEVANIYFLAVPVIAFITLMVGLKVDYQVDGRQISYNNDSLTEIGLGILTVASTIFSVKKYREQSNK